MSDLGSDHPGATPVPDRSGLRDKLIITAADLYAAEFANIQPVVSKYLSRRPSKSRAPFTCIWAEKLHKEMFGKVWKWAGEFRRENLNIGIEWQQIFQQLGNLFMNIEHWVNDPTNHETTLTNAARLHHRAVEIHPFLNGNGRWSRMLANIYLAQHRLPPTKWPEEGIYNRESSVRLEYLASLQQADRGDLTPLVDLHRRFGHL